MLDLGRALLRRAERRLIAARLDEATLDDALVAYLNRSLDLVYVLARRAADSQDEELSHT